MRRDGIASFFLIQHEDSRNDWVESALDHFLFDGLTWEEKRGPLGDHYRKLILPQSANCDLWQKFGLHGYVVRADADAMLAALKERRPDKPFRIVHRTISQHTEVMS